MRPYTGNSSIHQTRFTVIQVFGCFVNIIQKRLIRISHLQFNQTGSHRAIIIQTLATEDHVPTQFSYGIPTILFKGLIVLFAKEFEITFIEHKIHVLQNIFLILLVSKFIPQFHEGHIGYTIRIMPVIVLACYLHIHVKR